MPAVADGADPLLVEHARLRAQLDAWADAWRRRREHGGAAMVALMSADHLGEPLAVRLEQRLLLAKAHLERRITTHATALARAIAKLGGDAETTAIERTVGEMLARIGGADDDFGSKLAELGPLVEAYRRLRAAIDPLP